MLVPLKFLPLDTVQNNHNYYIFLFLRLLFVPINFMYLLYHVMAALSSGFIDILPTPKGGRFWYQQRLHISRWSYIFSSSVQCPAPCFYSTTKLCCCQVFFEINFMVFLHTSTTYLKIVECSTFLLKKFVYA